MLVCERWMDGAWGRASLGNNWIGRIEPTLPPNIERGWGGTLTRGTGELGSLRLEKEKGKD